MSAPLVSHALRALPSGRVASAIRLEHESRTNALNPELLGQLSAAIQAARADGAAFVHLSAAGRQLRE